MTGLLDAAAAGVQSCEIEVENRVRDVEAGAGAGNCPLDIQNVFQFEKRYNNLGMNVADFDDDDALLSDVDVENFWNEILAYPEKEFESLEVLGCSYRCKLKVRSETSKLCGPLCCAEKLGLYCTSSEMEKCAAYTTQTSI